MHAMMKMAMSASRLEMMARQDDVAVLQSAMREIAAELTIEVERAAPKWGELTGLIRDLEKGK